MKEEEDMRRHNNQINMYIFETNHEQQQTINTNVIMKFNNLAYVSRPLF